MADQEVGQARARSARNLTVFLLLCAAVGCAGDAHGGSMAPCVRGLPGALRLRGGFLGKLFSSETAGLNGAGSAPHGGGSPQAKAATKAVQTLSDEQCLRLVERWKRSGQKDSPGELMNTIMKGSCFATEDSEEEELVDDPATWFAVLQGVAERGHVKTLRCLIKQNVGGIVVDMRGRHGQTALHVAAARGQVRVVDTLCDLNANVNTTDLLGWVALHQAAYYGQMAVVQRLVEKYRASTSALTAAGLTPLALAEEQLRRCHEASDANLYPQEQGPDDHARIENLKATCDYLRSVVNQQATGAATFADIKSTANVAAPPSNPFAVLMQRLVGNVGVGDGQPMRKRDKSVSELEADIDKAWVSETRKVGDMGSGAHVGAGSRSSQPAMTSPKAAPERLVIGVARHSSLEDYHRDIDAAVAAAEARAVDKGGTRPWSDAGGPMAGGDVGTEPIICGVGLTLNLNSEGEYVTKSCAANGPAQGKVLPGDVLECVEGTPTRDVSYAELAGWILGVAGTTVQLSLRRGERLLHVTLLRAPLGADQQQAISQGLAREKMTLKQLSQVKKQLELDKQSLADQVEKLKRRCANAENEARVWKAISQQNSVAPSRAASRATSPGASDDDSYSASL